MRKAHKLIPLTLLCVLLFSCVTSDKDFDRSIIEENKEFEKVIKIEVIKEPVEKVKGKKVTKKEVAPRKTKKKSKGKRVKKATKKVTEKK